MNKIITVCFDFGNDNKFHKLHEVLVKSAKRNTEAMIISYHLPEPKMKYNRTRAFISNSVKLEKWVEELRRCEEEDHIILMDCDMLILENPFDVFEENFDIGYTVRTNSKWPLNGGVIFIKKNMRSMMFMNTLLKINNNMLQDPEFHKKWQQKYAGINQAALGCALENEIYNHNRINIKSFPCAIYNACGEDLPNFDKNRTRILHVKGKLRQAIFGEIETEPVLICPVSIWKEYAEMK